MNALHTPVLEQQKHVSAIHSLAEQYHLDEDIVRTIYERELKLYNSTAHIDQYLSLLTTRHVKELIRLGLIGSV